VPVLLETDPHRQEHRTVSTPELDARHKWIVPVKDVLGRDVILGIGLDDDGHVIVSVPSLGWFKVKDPELVEEIGYSITTAAYVARQRLRKEPTVAVSPAR
jgi:hypothetical protein